MMEIENKAPHYTWAEERQHAETRPAMYIGDPATAHRVAVVECLRLVWQAKVFRRIQSVTIDLSPTQYVVRVQCGPLIRAIQRNFRFGTGKTLGEPWYADNHAYSEMMAREEKERGVDYRWKRWNSGWRYCFCGPLGPRLDAPDMPFIFAHLLVWGVRTDAGMWCEGWADAAPAGKPFLCGQPSPIGLLAAAHLESQWFTGLPFTEADAQWFRDLSHRHQWSHPEHEPRRFWTPGEIIARWHPEDDLVTSTMLTAEGLRELLQEPPRVETRGWQNHTVQGT